MMKEISFNHLFKLIIVIKSSITSLKILVSQKFIFLILLLPKKNQFFVTSHKFSNFYYV